MEEEIKKIGLKKGNVINREKWHNAEHEIALEMRQIQSFLFMKTKLYIKS